MNLELVLVGGLATHLKNMQPSTWDHLPKIKVKIPKQTKEPPEFLTPVNPTSISFTRRNHQEYVFSCPPGNSHRWRCGCGRHASGETAADIIDEI